MANIQTLQEKVLKATEKVEKCKGTIARHEKGLNKKIQAVIKALDIDLTGKTKEEIDEVREPYRTTEHYWSFYEVTGKLDDIKGATKKLKEAERILEGHKERLTLEINRDNFLNDNVPQVIKDFLEDWKEKTIEWYKRRYDAYKEYAKKLNEEEEKANAEVGVKKGFMPSKSQREALEKMGMDWKSIQAKKANFAGGMVMNMVAIRDKEEREAWLEKQIEQDKKFKMLDLINRINHVVGEITDAQYLTIKAGNLNGYVIGKNGKAKVETIGAGGWNIQVFHYRTLVHKI